MRTKLALAALLAMVLARGSFAGGTLGDLILGFRDDGTDGGTGTGTNVTIDLGNFSKYEPGGSFYSPGVTDSLGISLTTDGLKTLYGTNYLTDTGLYFGIVGTNGTNANQDVLFVSAKATGGTPGMAHSTAWTVQSATSQNVQALKFDTLEVTNLGGFNGVSDTLTTLGYSWSAKESNSGGLSFAAFTTSAFETVAPGGSAMDLYVLDPQSSGPGVGNPGAFLGTFSIDSGGHLDFTAAAIPEAPAFAGILGSAALAASAWRRRSRAAI